MRAGRKSAVLAATLAGATAFAFLLATWSTGSAAPAAQTGVPTVMVATPNGPLEVADPAPYAASETMRYATTADGYAYLTAEGATDNAVCLVVAPPAGAAAAGQVGCDDAAGRAAGVIWMSTELAEGQVGGILLPEGTAAATVNGQPAPVEGEVLAFRAPRGVALEIEARNSTGSVVLRKTIPPSVGDISAGQGRPSDVVGDYTPYVGS